MMRREGIVAVLAAVLSCAAYAQGSEDAGTLSTSARKPAPVAPRGGSGSQGVQCGTERWSVKTMSDPDAGSVDVNNPVDATIASLISSPAASPWAGSSQPPDKRTLNGSSSETTVYRIQGTVIGYRMEKDHDFHVVIEGSDQTTPHQTMIVEIVDPTCAGAVDSVVLATLKSVRQSFLDQFGDPSTQPTGTTASISVHPEITQPQKYVMPSTAIPVIVTGVRFFDPIHGQTGVAPNGVELHPVLSIQRTDQGTP